MRKAALLYNPDSGGSRRRPLRELESALKVLRDGMVEADLVPTQSRSEAKEQTRQAIESGCDTIFACGGDGTIHNVAQVIVDTQVALAILPMGTANALAHDLKLPLNVIAAAKAALTGKPRRVAVGKVSFVDLQGQNDQRYFVAAAGVGADAHLFYKLQTGTKQKMGMAAYYAKAWNLWFTYPMTRFAVEYVAVDDREAAHQLEVTELMAIRIRNFGGALQEFAPGASLQKNEVRLILCRTASRMAYLAYVIRGVLRQTWAIPGIELASCTQSSCRYIDGTSGQDQRRIYVEADGELLGTLPADISIVPDALTILAPNA